MKLLRTLTAGSFALASLTLLACDAPANKGAGPALDGRSTAPTSRTTDAVPAGTIVTVRILDPEDRTGAQLIVSSATPYSVTLCGYDFVRSGNGIMVGVGAREFIADRALVEGMQLKLLGPAPRLDGLGGNVCNSGYLWSAVVL